VSARIAPPLDAALQARLALGPLGDRDGVRSRLLVDGEDTGTRLDGLALEAARATGSGVLALLTYDCPDEELLEAYLLDQCWRVLDRVRLGAPLAAGRLEGLRALDADTVAFSFFGDGDAWSSRPTPRAGACTRWPAPRCCRYGGRRRSSSRARGA
jgi:hypothetical protein